MINLCTVSAAFVASIYDDVVCEEEHVYALHQYP